MSAKYAMRLLRIYVVSKSTQGSRREEGSGRTIAEESSETKESEKRRR